MAREAGVRIRLATRLKETGGVAKAGAVVTQMTAENGDTFRAAVFLDATYEGDLMAQAGVSYTFGREASSQYEESLAGVRTRTTAHQFPVGLSSRAKDGRLYPEINPGGKGTEGSGDAKVQAYNYRLCMTDSPDRIPFPKPVGYDPARYALLAHYVDTLTVIGGGKAPGLGVLCKLSIVRGRKTDTNNNGGFSTDYIGHSWDYPEATYARRAAIWKEHEEYLRGFFYFLANDPSIPSATRADAAKWGLAKDEFTDNGNWPHQLYVREARRMIGEYVMVQADIQTARTKAEGVGMGSYNSDSHHVQRFVTPAGAVENEGDMQVKVEPYEIPYRILTPKRAQATNLLVPVCFSASHVSYSTLRMEPQYMILGEAAGVAARMAQLRGVPVQEIDVQALRAKLQSLKAALGTTPVSAWCLAPRARAGGKRIRIDLDARTAADGWQDRFGISGRALSSPVRGISIASPSRGVSMASP
jgi:hypothetical protein